MDSGKDRMEYLRHMKGSIFLIGFMGTGKSVISSFLGNKLGWECVDTDELIVRKAEGMPIKDIFSRYGEAYFRNLESKILSDLKNQKNINPEELKNKQHINDLEELEDKQHINGQIELKNKIDWSRRGHLVVSCGGGIVLRDENIEMMKELGVVVLLTASPETIYERVSSSTERPLLNKNMSVEAIAELLSERERRYLKAADLIVSTDDKTVRQIGDEIIEMLNYRKSEC